MYACTMANMYIRSLWRIIVNNIVLDLYLWISHHYLTTCYCNCTWVITSMHSAISMHMMRSFFIFKPKNKST